MFFVNTYKMARSKEIQFIINFNKLIGRMFEFGASLVYARWYRKIYRMCKCNTGEMDFSKDEIDAYKKKWGVLGRVNPIYYKMFAHYIGRDLNILPDDLSQRAVESLLNPTKFRALFEDKNMFDRILGYDFMPETYIRSIGGFVYKRDYSYISEPEKELIKRISGQKRVVAKKTLETCSGDDVIIFEQNLDGRFIAHNSDAQLSIDVLNARFGKDWVVQEYLKQSEFMERLCPTSVNTFRILVYRSVKDDSIHVLQAGIRIGHNGALLDNSHQGGLFVGIKENGYLNDYLTDQYGIKYSVHNGIDFSKEKIYIPDWERIKGFAREVGRRIPYHRCLNLDVMIRENGEPTLIEFNIGRMSVWLYQAHTGSCFGRFTDEVIEYCQKHKDEVMSQYCYV